MAPPNTARSSTARESSAWLAMAAGSSAPKLNPCASAVPADRNRADAATMPRDRLSVPRGAPGLHFTPAASDAAPLFPVRLVESISAGWRPFLVSQPFGYSPGMPGSSRRSILTALPCPALLCAALLHDSQYLTSFGESAGTKNAPKKKMPGLSTGHLQYLVGNEDPVNTGSVPV